MTTERARAKRPTCLTVLPVLPVTTKEPMTMTERADAIEAALVALLNWAREHTSPRDANSPHDLLVAACHALDLPAD